MWAFRRQLVGLSFFGLIILGAVGYIGYRLYPQYSCFDRVKNGQETEIDCGGPECVSCLGQIREPRILWTRFFRVRDGVYDAGALLENPNLQVGARKISYTFKIYDAEGVILDTKSNSTYVYPNERAFLYVSNLRSGAKEAARTELQINNIDWAKIDSGKGLKIDVARKVFEQNPAPILTVTLKNTSLFSEKALEIFVILERADGNAYAASRTVLENFPSNSEQDAIFTWPASSFEAPTNIQILYRRTLE
ncbi:MAG: hypothetical protein AAB372_01930 [Patescibacteria group bacterium]